MRKGYVQVYTGNGKGKTTAALGLALRAAGAGLKVFIVQFMKKQKCSEHLALERFRGMVTVRLCGTGLLRGKRPSTADMRAALNGLEEARKAIGSGNYDVVILDEANVATYYELIQVKDLLDLIGRKPAKAELVITGRYADQKVLEAADLVTEMLDVKHYGKQGVLARRGIEK